MAITQKHNFRKEFENLDLKFFTDSAMKTEKGNKPIKTNNGTIINKPPWPSIGAENLPKLFSKKNPLVHSPFVSLCTNRYQGNDTANTIIPAINIFQENTWLNFLSQISHKKIAAPGNRMDTGPFANVPNPSASAQIRSQENFFSVK